MNWTLENMKTPTFLNNSCLSTNTCREWCIGQLSNYSINKLWLVIIGMVLLLLSYFYASFKLEADWKNFLRDILFLTGILFLVIYIWINV